MSKIVYDVKSGRVGAEDKHGMSSYMSFARLAAFIESETGSKVAQLVISVGGIEVRCE